MPCLWLQHNKSQLFIDVAIIDALAINVIGDPAATGAIMQPPQTFNALVDTGAQKTMISASVANTLGLLPQGQIPIQGVGPNVTYHNGYLFHVGFMIPLITPVAVRGQMQVGIFIQQDVIWGAELPAPVGFDVLLGMDVLSTGSLVIGG